MEKRFTILHTEWSEGWGGQEMRILAEMKAHREMGHGLFLLCPPKTRLAKEAEELGLRVIPYKIRQAWDLKAIRTIRKVIRDSGVEIVHTHSSVDSWAAGMAARWARGPVLVRTRHISVPVKRPRLNRLYYLPDAIVTTGEHIRRDLLRSHKIPSDRVVSIPTGVDTGRFSPRLPAWEVKKALGFPEDARVITSVAVLRTQKRHELILEAAGEVLREFPQARFLFVGEGPGQRRVERAVSARGLNQYVHLSGYRSDIPEILSFTEVGVIASVAEGVPQFLFQVMAMARPFVSTAVGGIPDIAVRGDNGLLVPPEDSQALARAIIRLLRDPEEAGRLGAQGRLRVERDYTVERMAEKVLQVYHRVWEVKTGKRVHG